MVTSTSYDFDQVHDRSDTSAAKWEYFDKDVLPLFVAEMDFKAPAAITDVMKERVEHGFFGYTMCPDELREVLVARLKTHYNWDVKPEWLLFNPGMVLTLNLVAQAAAQPGNGVLMQTPVYGPFMNASQNRGLFSQMVDLVQVPIDDNTFCYEIDFDAFEAAITPQSKLFFLCDPHNPGGKIFRRDELERLAEICLKHDIIIGADSIHGDLLLDDQPFIPVGALSPEIAQQSITMLAPTKTFNLPGLACSISVIPNDDLREKVEMKSRMSGYHVDTLAYEAALAAYKYGDDWLQAALAYIRENREIVVSFIRERLPMLKTTVPEATYLAWVDCSALDIGEHESPHHFFLKQARVALSPGTFFGESGKEFVRLNFACPRSILQEALERMEAAINHGDIKALRTTEMSQLQVNEDNA